MRIILVSHGRLADGMLQASRMICGEDERITSMGLMPEEDPMEFGGRIERELVSAGKQKEQVLVLSDLFFGSPFNSAAQLMRDYEICHVTGMNLAMVIQAIELMQGGSTDVNDIAATLIQSARDGIKDVNEYFGTERRPAI